MGTIMPHGQGDATSPFDAIMHMDEQGEHTTGRELMPLLGYAKWERFSDAMDMAYHVVVTEQGETAADLAFSRYREATDGRDRENVRLTRYAAYLTAMRGDSRKPEIRAALIYFAVQTRIAETRVSAPVGTPTVALPPAEPAFEEIGHSRIMVTREPGGLWLDATDMYFYFGFKDSAELAAWLPESERRQVPGVYLARGLPLWRVSEAGLARLLRERKPAPCMPYGSTLTHQALTQWAQQGHPALPAPTRRALER